MDGVQGQVPVRAQACILVFSLLGQAACQQPSALPAPSSPRALPEFPAQTTVQEPYLGLVLDLSSPLEAYFASTAALRREHERAHRAIQSVSRELRARRWDLQVRTGCPVEDDRNVRVEGRAIVRDATGQIRAYAEGFGTGDSFSTWKFYYDSESHLRVATFSWANYTGLSADGVMRFDSTGQLERCSSSPDSAPPWSCDVEAPPENTLDPNVASVLLPDVLQEEARTRWPTGWALALDPAKEFSKCEIPYVRTVDGTE